MKLISEQLQLFVRDSLNPQRFAGHHFSNEEFEKWKIFLTNEIAELKPLLGSLPEPVNKRSKAIIVTYINHIVDLSNVLHGYLTQLRPIWKGHPQAEQIRSNYLLSLNALEDVIALLIQAFPRVRGFILISNYKLSTVKMELKAAYKLLNNLLNISGIDSELKEVVLVGFSQLIAQKEMKGQDLDYFIKLCAIISKQDELSDKRLIDLLITHDFNLPEFFQYCINHWRKRLSDIPGLHEQQELILSEKDHLYSHHINKGLKLPDASSVLYDDLNQFLSEKYTYVSNLLKVRREAILDKEKAKAGIRFLMNMPVPQFGLFIRLQIERGLLPKENVGELFAFFASHFYTPHTLFISAESLQKKSTDVEFSTAQKMKGQLIAMLNWLNTNFNLSNFN